MELNIQQDGFRQDNTEGYTNNQLDSMNAELGRRVAKIKEGDTDTYHQTVKSFSDVVASMGA